MIWRPRVWYCIPAVRSPSQHMHIVFISERLKLACTYILCNLELKSTETRLCQSGIPPARAMGPAIGVHPWRRILACTQTVSKCSKRGMARGSYRLFCSPVLWEWYQMGTYLSEQVL